jgi:hypothetical protein
MKTAEEILAPFVERPFRHTEIIEKDNALKAMESYANQPKDNVLSLNEHFLILVGWVILDAIDVDGYSNEYELDYDSDTDKVTIIALKGIGSLSSDFISDIGLDIFDENAINSIKTYIKKETNKELSLHEIIRGYKQPTDGEFIVTVRIDGYLSSNPETSLEGDIDFKFIGILGSDIKLIQ